MELDDYINRVDAFIKALETEGPAIADEVALNGIALIKNRIIDQRHGIDGAEYSTRKMLATRDQFVVKSAFKQSVVEETRFHRKKDKDNFHSSQIGKKTTKKGDEKKVVKKKLWIKFPNADKAVPVMILEQGYKEFREIQGRPGDHVNASLTGKMWQGTTIVGRIKSGFTYVTVIGGGNQEAQNKLVWMTDKYGMFLAVRDDEVRKLRDLVEKRIDTIYKRFF